MLQRQLGKLHRVNLRHGHAVGVEPARAGVEGARFRVHTPLIALTKANIIRRGLELGLDYGLTNSCYDPSAEGVPCGRCDSCALRARGFAEAGVADPVLLR